MRINLILFIASSFEGRGHKNIQQVAPTFPYFLASFLSNQTNRSLFYDLPPHLKSVKKGSGGRGKLYDLRMDGGLPSDFQIGTLS